MHLNVCHFKTNIQPVLFRLFYDEYCSETKRRGLSGRDDNAGIQLCGSVIYQQNRPRLKMSRPKSINEPIWVIFPSFRTVKSCQSWVQQQQSGVTHSAHEAHVPPHVTWADVSGVSDHFWVGIKAAAHLLPGSEKVLDSDLLPLFC